MLAKTRIYFNTFKKISSRTYNVKPKYVFCANLSKMLVNDLDAELKACIEMYFI